MMPWEDGGALFGEEEGGVRGEEVEWWWRWGVVEWGEGEGVWIVTCLPEGVGEGDVILFCSGLVSFSSFVFFSFPPFFSFLPFFLFFAVSERREGVRGVDGSDVVWVAWSTEREERVGEGVVWGGRDV